MRLLSVVLLAVVAVGLPAGEAASQTRVASIAIGIESLDGPARGGPLAVAGALLLARRRGDHRPDNRPDHRADHRAR